MFVSYSDKELNSERPKLIVIPEGGKEGVHGRGGGGYQSRITFPPK